MANLQETSQWEAGIYQLETSDPVMGGENGIDNRAPRQLANRTLWLKNELARQIGTVNSGKLGKTENAVSATKLATVRQIAITGDGTGQANFDGSQNASIPLTLANSGVTAGSYNSVTVDAKGRVTAGLTQVQGLITATTATETSNQATTNANTFLNIVASGVGQVSSVGSSTQITGTNGITASSDTAGKLIISQTNAPTATKLQAVRNIAMTGDGAWNVNFDGSQNATGAMTLANSGVTAGSYNSVTVDAKGRVTAGLTQTHGLVTATTATGTANVATTNANTFLNIVASGVGTTNSVGSSTQITGTNGITVSSDTAGKLIIGQTLANALNDTSTAKALTALQGKTLNDSKVNKTGDTMTGHLRVEYAGDWVGLVANNTTAGKHIYFDGHIGGICRGGIQIVSTGGGKYETKIMATPAGDDTKDRRVSGLVISDTGLYTHAYGNLHDFFAKTTDVQSINGKVIVMTGVIEHGGTIPLPSGFNENQCKWMVSINHDNLAQRSWDINENGSWIHYRQECFTVGRIVTVGAYIGNYGNPTFTAGRANYIIIGVK